jgi:hypothetical protein
MSRSPDAYSRSTIKNELIPKGEAQRMLKKLIKANEAGGTPDQVAATMLTAVLQDVSAFQPATRQ